MPDVRRCKSGLPEGCAVPGGWLSETERLDALVLDLDTRAGLAITRTLGRAGLRIAAAAREDDASGLLTRYAHARIVLPSPEHDFEAYAEGMFDFLNARPADVVIPSTDWSVEALAHLRDRLAGIATPALAEPGPLSVASSKVETLKVAHELGLPAPRSIRVTTPAETVAAAAEIGLPAVLKPTASWRSVERGGERVGPVYLAGEADVHAAATALVRSDAPALVQEFATGDRETVKLFRRDGVFQARLVMLVERTWPLLGGSSVMRTTIAPSSELVDLAERLVAEIGLEGYAEVEFRRDRAPAGRC